MFEIITVVLLTLIVTGVGVFSWWIDSHSADNTDDNEIVESKEQE